MTPCDDALKAMPGDEIQFDDNGSKVSAIVQSAGWHPTPKGGRVWCYELWDGAIINNERVLKVTKMQNEVARPETKTNLIVIVDQLQIPSSLKTAMTCIVKGDLENLEVAQFLIRQRISDLENARSLAVDPEL